MAVFEGQKMTDLKTTIAGKCRTWKRWTTSQGWEMEDKIICMRLRIGQACDVVCHFRGAAFLPLTQQGWYYYVAAKATYIRLLHGKISFWGFFGPSSVKRGRTHIVLG